MPAARRASLLHMALTALGSCALPACTGVLLAHALNSYNPEADTSNNNNNSSLEQIEGENGTITVTPMSASGTTNYILGIPQGGLILLSRSSQRKASRTLKSSQPEELFRLAMDCVLSASAEVRRLVQGEERNVMVERG